MAIQRKLRLKLPLERKLRPKGRFRGKLFLAEWAPNDFGVNRFAVVIRSAEVKGAAKRNRIRRVTLGAASLWPPRGLDVLFFPSRASAASTRKQISEEILNIKHRALGQ